MAPIMTTETSTFITIRICSLLVARAKMNFVLLVSPLLCSLARLHCNMYELVAAFRLLHSVSVPYRYRYVRTRTISSLRLRCLVYEYLMPYLCLFLLGGKLGEREDERR